MELLSAGDLEVPAFTAAIEAHQKRITQAILDHALQICSNKIVGVLNSFSLCLCAFLCGIEVLNFVLFNRKCYAVFLS